jgi:hypothetical protein
MVITTKDESANLAPGTEYMEAIIVVASFTLALFAMPETYAPVLLRRKAQRMRKTTGDERYWHPHEKEKVSVNNIVTKYLSRPLRWVTLWHYLDR